MDLITNAFRTLMFFFDNIVYGLIPTIYTLLVYLSQIDIFSTDTGIGELVSQIYTLLGIFMLFKISFSILQYLIDPNSFSDNSKGIGKILKNVIVAIILLVMVPFIFQFAAKLQYIVVNSNILGNLILGSTSASVTETDINLATIEPSEVLNQTSGAMNESAKDLQFLMFGAFFSVNTDVISSCENSPIFGSVEMAQSTACLEELEGYFESETDISSNNVTLGSFFKYVEDGVVQDKRDFADFDKLLWWRVDNEYAIDYLPFISTAAGIYVIFLLITFCIDVAVRAIKLCFLQMVAPISIVSYIDPKESMGNSKLRNWINECLKTYVSLFIRLAIIFFVMRLISIIASGVFSDEGFVQKLNADEYTMWIYLFLVLGAFMFAKQVPKMIETLFGWKSTGELQLNPLKSITSNADASALVGGAAGFAGGLAANLGNMTAKGIQAHGKQGDFRKKFLGVKPGEFSNATAVGKIGVVGRGVKNFFGNTAGSVLGGSIAGAVHSGYASRSGKISEGLKTGHDKVITNREARDSRQQQNWGARVTNAATQFAGTKNEYGSVGTANQKIKDLQEQLQQTQQIQEQFRESYAKKIKDLSVSHQVDFNQLSGLDFNKSLGDQPKEIQSIGEDAYKELKTLSTNIEQTKAKEKNLKKEIENQRDAAGIKKEDKK